MIAAALNHAVPLWTALATLVGCLKARSWARSRRKTL